MCVLCACACEIFGMCFGVVYLILFFPFGKLWPLPQDTVCISFTDFLSNCGVHTVGNWQHHTPQLADAGIMLLDLCVRVCSWVFVCMRRPEVDIGCFPLSLSILSSWGWICRWIWSSLTWQDWPVSFRDLRVSPHTLLCRGYKRTLLCLTSSPLLWRLGIKHKSSCLCSGPRSKPSPSPKPKRWIQVL